MQIKKIINLFKILNAKFDVTSGITMWMNSSTMPFQRNTAYAKLVAEQKNKNRVFLAFLQGVMTLIGQEQMMYAE